MSDYSCSSSVSAWAPFYRYAQKWGAWGKEPGSREVIDSAVKTGEAAAKVTLKVYPENETDIHYLGYSLGNVCEFDIQMVDETGRTPEEYRKESRTETPILTPKQAEPFFKMVSVDPKICASVWFDFHN